MYGIQISKKYGTRILGNAYFEAVIDLLNAAIYSVTNLALLRGSERFMDTLNALNRSFLVILLVMGTKDWIPQYSLRSFQRYPLKAIQTPKGLLLKYLSCNSDRC
jgi:hypothetical protein